jgi:hypothetical protein
MENYSIFHIEGGLGKHVAATAVAKCIQENYPDRKLIVVCAYPEVFINLPFVWRVYRIGNTPYFYDNYIKNKKSLIFKGEPYFMTEHINGELPLIQTWCKLFNLTYTGQTPEIIFNAKEIQAFSRKWIREKPILLLHTNGGPLNNQPYLQSWTRDMPQLLAQAVVETYINDYHIIQVCRNDMNALQGVEVVKESMSNMELFYLIKSSQKRLLIDSCLQHASAALNSSSVVLWVATNPQLFGYSNHINIKANLPREIPLPDSYLFDYNFNGSLYECPILEGDVLFNFEQIKNSIDSL